MLQMTNGHGSRLLGKTLDTYRRCRLLGKLLTTTYIPKLAANEHSAPVDHQNVPVYKSEKQKVTPTFNMLDEAKGLHEIAPRQRWFQEGLLASPRAGVCQGREQSDR